MTITFERYLKVVHPFWSKTNLKRWVIYAAMAFAWIAGILSFAPIVFISTIVEDGMCLAFTVWESPEGRKVFIFFNTFSYLVVPVIVFVFCYARIVAVMRRQMSDGSTQRRGFSTDELLADAVQTNQVEHRQNDDHRQYISVIYCIYFDK